MTSAFVIFVVNQASSPNLPNLYLDRKKSFGNPQATDTNLGLGLLLGSISVENPLRSALDRYRVVQQIDCITDHSQKTHKGQTSHQTIFIDLLSIYFEFVCLHIIEFVASRAKRTKQTQKIKLFYFLYSNAVNLQCKVIVAFGSNVAKFCELSS